MSEETLNNLFAQARHEAPETSTREVLGWIGGGTIMMLLAAWLMKFKVILISKPLIMISSLITVAGITAGTILLVPSSGIRKATNTAGQLKPQTEKSIPAVQDPIPAEKIPEEHEVRVRALPMEKPTGIMSVVLPAIGQSMNYNVNFCAGVSTVAEAPVMEEGIGEFHAIEISGVANVVIIQDLKNDVWIESKNADEEKVTIKNENGTLKISQKSSGKEKSGQKVTVFVNLKNIDKIVCTDACSLTSQGGLEFESLRIESEGAPDLKLNLTVKNLDLDISGATNMDLWVMSEKVVLKAGGAADITLKGEAEELNLVNGGAVNVEANELKVTQAIISSSGASHAKLFITGRVDIDANGASRIKYKGNPEQGKITVAEAAHLGRF